jgi:hypothetical protein
MSVEGRKSYFNLDIREERKYVSQLRDRKIAIKRNIKR